MFKEDFHIHTFFSPDSKTSPEEVISEAEEKGLSHIIFTDHCECNLNEALPEGKPLWFPLDLENYTKTIEKLKEKTDVKIGIGIELGQATLRPEKAKEVLEFYPWDFVLGSMHNTKNGIDFYYVDYHKEDLDMLARLYFEDLYDLALQGEYDVLSHLYYHLRYVYRQNLTYDIMRFEEEIREIFSVVTKKGKGIEVNTSSTADVFSDIIPELKILKIYKELGGEIITVGSDAHKKERVGLSGDYALSMIKEAGFKAISVFENRKVSFVDI